MLSILIPTYNYDCTLLVKDLHKQAIECKIPFEIIVAEDGSLFHKQTNRKIKELSNTKYIEIKENIGRSKIRNLLADVALFQYLLFIDCDAKVCKNNYISEYLKHCTPKCCVIGGICYDKKDKKTQYSLRLKYGFLRESKTERFTAFNFLIHKEIFKKVKFNESIQGYGHEDSLFGAQVKQFTQYKIINNQLIHKGLDSNKIFLEKTESAIYNLWVLSQDKSLKCLFNESSLLQTFNKLKKLHLVEFIGILFSITSKIIKKQITSKNPSLFLFDCYKIGYLCQVFQNDKTFCHRTHKKSKKVNHFGRKTFLV